MAWTEEYRKCRIPGRDEFCRKELEDTGAFLEPVWELSEYVAMQPNGTWWAFDSKPILTETGWVRQYDQPDQVFFTNVNMVVSTITPFDDWRKCLYQNHRYKHKLTKVRRTINVGAR